MAKNKGSFVHLLLLLLVIAVFIWSVIKPAGYLIWSMEVLPAVVVCILAIVTYHRFRLTTLSYIIIAILSIMMFVGGHYTYSEVPLFNWIKDEFSLKRNHYDRFGHLLKGFSAIVIREILVRKSPVKKGPWLLIFVLSITLAMGALYEIIEWLSAIISKKGKTATEFLGTQGDIWDSQWDMALTLIGSILSLVIFSKWHNKLIKNIRLKVREE